MKKPLVYFACCLVSIAPIQSYAVDLSKGQIVQMGKKGGAYIKTAGGVAMKIGNVGRAVTPFGAVLYCVSSKKCKDRLEDAYEIACEIIAGDEDCTISRKEIEDESGQCIVRFGKDKLTMSAFISSASKTVDDGSYTTKYYAHPDTTKELKRYAGYALDSANPNYHEWTFIHGQYPFSFTTSDKLGNTSDGSDIYYVSVWYKCGGTPDDKKLSDSELEELAKKIAKNMDDDDIKNYYNYDYGDITINNNRYDGDEINNQTNIEKQCQENSCNEISKEIESDINNKKYDIDDVNEQNCTMENKKYISCNVKKSDDDDTTNNQDDTTNDTNNTKKDDDDEHWCKTSDLTKEACEFFDWVDDEPEKPEDKKVDIEDEEEDKLDKDKIDIDESCPPDQHIKLSMPWGYSTTIEFTYKPYCDFARDLKPYMTATGAIVAMYIVGSCGRRL